MCVHDHFIGDPNKPQYIDADDIEDDIQYISDEDTFFLEHIEDPSNPEADFIFGNLDVDDDDDDDDPVYDPADEFVDFLSDSEDETSIYEGILGSDVENSTELSSEETGDEGESDESKKVVDIKNSSDISSDSSNVESDSMV